MIEGMRLRNRNSGRGSPTMSMAQIPDRESRVAVLIPSAVTVAVTLISVGISLGVFVLLSLLHRGL
jgi:hypothetical protein